MKKWFVTVGCERFFVPAETAHAASCVAVRNVVDDVCKRTNKVLYLEFEVSAIEVVDETRHTFEISTILLDCLLKAGAAGET